MRDAPCDIREHRGDSTRSSAGLGPPYGRTVQIGHQGSLVFLWHRWHVGLTDACSRVKLTFSKV